MTTSKMYLNSAAAAILALAGFAADASAVPIININLGNAGSTNALDGTAYMAGGFAQAPAAYTGTTWNDFAAQPVTATGLLDSDGNVTTVGITTVSTNAPAGLQNPSTSAGGDNVKLLKGCVNRNYNSTSGNVLYNRFTISGLDTAKTYNIYLVSAHNTPAKCSWRIGATGTDMFTTNTADTRTAETWVAGDDYVAFDKIVPDADGKILVSGRSVAGANIAFSGLTLNGLQVMDATDMQSCSFGVLGTGWISGTNVNLYVPTSTDVSSLTPTFTLSTGATITPTTPQDFSTSSVAYTVTPAVGPAKVYTISAIVGTMPTFISNTLTPADALNPALGVDIDTAVGTGNTGLLVGVTQTYNSIGGVTVTVPLILNGKSLIIDSAGNTMNVSGPISGDGMLTFRNGYSIPMQVSGSTGNTYTGTTTISSAQVSLEKTSGDALGGSIMLTNAAAKMTWTASDQIADSANIYLNVSGASLDLGARTDTINELYLTTGTTVQTATGGILRVAKLFVNGVQQPDVARMEGDGYVLGAGSIEVGASGPATWVPSTPATPAPANGSNYGPAYLAALTKLDWSDGYRVVSYDVYLWDASGSKPGTPTATGLTSSELTTLPTLLSEKTYKWQIVAKNTQGDTLSPEWIFTTFDLNMIGLKYDRGNTLLATDVAGAPYYEQANWTMAPGQGQGPPVTPISSLKDKNGVATSVNVTSWTVNNNNCYSWSTPDTLDKKLLADYCASGCSISFEGLSTYAPSGYAVVVSYAANGRNQRFILTAGSTTITRNVMMTAPESGTPFWLEGTESSPGTASNYTVLGSAAARLTSDTFTIALDMTANSWVGGTAAVQIVQLPPTATLTPYEIWATDYAGDQSPSEDYNNDGVSNGVAFFMGMNGLATNPGVVDGKVTWPQVGTVTSWEVQVSDNLQDWSAADAGDVDTTSSPGNVIYTLPTGAAQKFCRLMVVP